MLFMCMIATMCCCLAEDIKPPKGKGSCDTLSALSDVSTRAPSNVSCGVSQLSTSSADSKLSRVVLQLQSLKLQQDMTKDGSKLSEAVRKMRMMQQIARPLAATRDDDKKAVVNTASPKSNHPVLPDFVLLQHELKCTSPKKIKS